MRTISTEQAAIWRTGAFSAALALEIYRSGAWVNLGALDGRDWIESAKVRETVDSPHLDLRASLIREEGDGAARSLAPLNAGSIYHAPSVLVEPPNLVRLRSGLDGFGYVPVDASLLNLFEGRIDRVGFGGAAAKLTFDARDRAGKLQNEWIETQGVYPLAGPPADTLESVVAQIIDDHYSDTDHTLYVPAASSTGLTSYTQQKGPIHNTVRALSLAIGWDLRWRWHTGTSAWRYTLYEPPRSDVTSVFEFQPWEYIDLPVLDYDIAWIRNRVRVCYTDADGKPQSYLAIDQDSIDKYGPLFMETAEELGSQLDTATEAQRLADAAISDLAWPTVQARADVPFFPWVQLGDVYTFKADGVRHTSDLVLAVVGYEHTWDAKKHPRTIMDLRGKPSGGQRRWHEVAVNPGRIDGADRVSPGTPAGVTLTQFGNNGDTWGLNVAYTRPTALDWLTTEVYASETSGFAPGSSNLKAEGRTAFFRLPGFAANGGTWYVRLRTVDYSGNRSGLSSEASHTFT